jgi:hypothetical protein
MKAKIKQTGEIVDVEPYFYAKINSTDPMMHKNDIELIEPNADIDYEQRRYEIAKAMLPVIYLDDGQAERADDSDLGFEYKSDRHCAKEAVDFADALIEELKKRK